MPSFALFGPRRAAVLTLAGAALLAGCAVPQRAVVAPAPAVAAAAAAPLIATPPTNVGTWFDLGHVLAPWLAGDAPVPVTGVAAPTRVAGLKREDGRWLAIVLVQVAPAGSAPCPIANGLHVSEAVGGDGCLRARRDADFDHWLEQQHSVLSAWLDGRGLTSRPRAWVGYRARSGALEAHALIDPALIEPVTRNNTDFLAGGQPGLVWARAFAAATAASAGGVLAVPPFPFGAPMAPAPEPLPVPAPTRATQVLPSAPPPALPAPRRDRE